MRVVVFLVFLCFLLLRGNGEGADRHNGVGDAFTKNVASTIKSIHDDYLVISDTDSNTEKEFIVSDGVDDENTDNSFARKYKLLAGYHTAYACYAALSTDYDSCKTFPSFYGQSSHKYILQRALRL
jgi:hypothetical protein